MILPIKKLKVKVYNHLGEFRGYSNLTNISKNKVKNAKKDIEGVRIGIFDYRTTIYKDGYKMNRNPIIYK